MMMIQSSFGRQLRKGEAVILLRDQAVPQPRVGVVIENHDDPATGVKVLWANEHGAPYISCHLQMVLASVHPIEGCDSTIQLQSIGYTGGSRYI